MKTLQMKLSSGASLSGYLWEESEELNIRKRAAVLVFPGGGYMMCSDREAEPVALAYYAEGYNAFVLHYTVQKGFYPPFEDAKEALSLIRENVEAWRVIPGKIAVCGFSAGGHLGAAMGTLAKDRPDALILGYPAVIGKDWERLFRDIPDLPPEADEKTPPCFLFAASDDKVVPVRNSLVFAEALESKGVPFEMHIFGRGGHGFSLAKPVTASGDGAQADDHAAAWFPLSVRWLSRVFGTVFEYLPEKKIEGVSSALLMPIGELAENAKARAVLEKYHFLNQTMLDSAGKMTLYAIKDYLPLDDGALGKLAEELEEALS